MLKNFRVFLINIIVPHSPFVFITSKISLSAQSEKAYYFTYILYFLKIMKFTFRLLYHFIKLNFNPLFGANKKRPTLAFIKKLKFIYYFLLGPLPYHESLPQWPQVAFLRAFVAVVGETTEFLPRVQIL